MEALRASAESVNQALIYDGDLDSQIGLNLADLIKVSGRTLASATGLAARRLLRDEHRGGANVAAAPLGP
ncbi:MAG: hypothetical protein H7X93_08045 [Sphingomonadaceae bacterium]|nr:hypothetical protein [Sphingomonadaceae bacterium]